MTRKTYTQNQANALAAMKRDARDVLADAAALADHHNTALAAEIREIKIPGKKRAEGPTDHNLKLANLWCAIDDRVKAGEKEADVLAKFAAGNEVDYDYKQLCDLRDLKGKKEVRRILKDRGRI